MRMGMEGEVQENKMPAVKPEMQPERKKNTEFKLIGKFQYIL